MQQRGNTPEWYACWSRRKIRRFYCLINTKIYLTYYSTYSHFSAIISGSYIFLPPHKHIRKCRGCQIFSVLQSVWDTSQCLPITRNWLGILMIWVKYKYGSDIRGLLSGAAGCSVWLQTVSLIVLFTRRQVERLQRTVTSLDSVKVEHHQPLVF